MAIGVLLVCLTDFDLLSSGLRDKVRFKRGQHRGSRIGIMDSQSVRWSDNRSLSGIDGNKKVKGIKRHVIVDKNDSLVAVMATAANAADCKAAYLLTRTLKELCSPIKVILADGGYWGEIAGIVRKAFGYVIQVFPSNFKEQSFRPIHKRWVVEKSFSWFDNYRSLCRNYELTFDSAKEMVKIANIRLLLNKIKQVPNRTLIRIHVF